MIHGPIRVPLQWYNERRYVIRSVTSICSLCLSVDWSVGCCIVGWSELSNYNFLSSSFSVCNFQINPFDSGENLFKSNWPSVCLERLIRGYYFFISWVKTLILEGTAFFIAGLPKTRVSDPHFFADPDPDKNFHADPDPGVKGKNQICLVFFMFQMILNNF